MPDGTKTYDQMLPQYTFALGGSDAIKKLKDWLDDQAQVLKRLENKIKAKDEYTIG